jgi:hypothetical protein
MGNDKKKHRPAVHSEWAAVGVLRPDWSRSTPRLTVLYPENRCRVELACGKTVLWSGDWTIDLKIDGSPVATTSDWKQLCWVSDSDIDYLELEIDLAEGFRMQRHFAMARKDGFLFMADAVLGTGRRTIDYRGTLPLRSGVSFCEANETRQGTLLDEKALASVLPLAMPELQSVPASGGLSAVDGGLQLHHTAEGAALFAPLFFDFERRRFRRPALWRQLTVAEFWQVQPADVAVGYRIATGKEQWLFYRSLTKQGNRSVLGHNISNEMILGRFDREGEVQALIEIE